MEKIATHTPKDTPLPRKGCLPNTNKKHPCLNFVATLPRRFQKHFDMCVDFHGDKANFLFSHHPNVGGMTRDSLHGSTFSCKPHFVLIRKAS